MPACRRPLHPPGARGEACGSGHRQPVPERAAESGSPDADALRGLGACFVAGTISSAAAALITVRIRDDASGLRCGPCICVAAEAKADVELE